jgi:hypothetical protein
MRADLQPVAGNVRSQGAAVVLELSRYRHGQPGNAVLYPQIIKSLGSNMNVGWLTMIPYVCGGIAMAGWGLLFDRMNEQRWHLLAACTVSTIGLVIAGMTMGAWWALVGMSITVMGFYGSKGPFWAMPPMFLTGARRPPAPSRGSTRSAIWAASSVPGMSG